MALSFEEWVRCLFVLLSLSLTCARLVEDTVPYLITLIVKLSQPGVVKDAGQRN